LLQSVAFAQIDYPSRPMRIIVPLPPDVPSFAGPRARLRSHIRSEMAKWAAVVKKSGARVD
jgi:hypothetical protein